MRPIIGGGISLGAQEELRAAMAGVIQGAFSEIYGPFLSRIAKLAGFKGQSVKGSLLSSAAVCAEEFL